MSLRVLQVCPKTPLPAIDGGCIAANNVTQGLLKLGHNVKVMTLSTPKHPADECLQDSDYVSSTSFESCFIDTTINPLDALARFFSRRSYNVDRFYSRKFEEMLVSVLQEQEFDVVQLESTFTAPYRHAIRKACNAPIVCRSHNLEYQIWEGTAALQQNPLKRAYISHLARQLKRYERRIANEFDGIATITKADKDTFRALGCKVPIETIPFGMDLSSVTSDVEPTSNSVFHLGSMDWLPNQDGIRWFIDEVWPGVLQKYPGLKLYLAGRSMPAWLLELREPGIEVVGEVENAHDFIASKSIMVVPLHSGGGMRIKIVEGLALGSAIVSTSLGAAGIDYSDGENIMIADTAAEFGAKLIKLISDPELCQRVSTGGTKLAREYYDNDAIIRRLAGFYESLIGRRADSLSSGQP